jgi:DNA (cytosine-5)-methyltransferase 1
MNCGHLFNGIGGFALAAHWMGWANIMHCEIDPFCNKVMNYHFPNSFQHEDIRTTDFTIWRGKLDLITGGFPCQPYSTAGKRKGKEDDRHLWPQMLRAIREIQPRYVVGENVRGLTNWNGGLVFDEVQADLETEGYEVLPVLLPACAVNAPHKRDRIWLVAHANSFSSALPIQQRGQGKTCHFNIIGENESRIITNANDLYGREGAGREDRAQVDNSYYGITTDANSIQRCKRGMHEEGSETAAGHACTCDTRDAAAGITTHANSFGLPVGHDQQDGRGAQPIAERSNGITSWQDFPTQSPVCAGNDGLSGGLADITFSKWRKKSIKALGNAVVPQVVFQIFKAIEQWRASQ